MHDLHEIQMQLEEEMFNGGIRRFEAEQARHISNGAESDTAWNRRLISEFIAPMAAGIAAYKEEYTGKAGRPHRALAYLHCVENEVAAYITMKVVMDMLSMDVTYQAIAMTVAERIEDQVRFSKLEGVRPSIWRRSKQTSRLPRPSNIATATAL